MKPGVVLKASTHLGSKRSKGSNGSKGSFVGDNGDNVSVLTRCLPGTF